LDVAVRFSSIHKQGVFALRDFCIGEIVLRWDTSVCISKEDIDTIQETEKGYLHPYSSDRLILVQSPERFVNHSCNHNTEVHNYCDVAIRDIASGEEITSNYETDGAGHIFECHCGSPNCRGMIGGFQV
jgi:hypothetical protein